MNWRCILIAAILLVLAAIVWVVRTFPAHRVGVHQRGVTQELADWKTEYSTIESQHDAVRTAEMLEIVQWYYVPSEDYRSTPNIEAALQSQRQATIDSFVEALGRYTDEDFGTDSSKWLAHLKSARSDKVPSPAE